MRITILLILTSSFCFAQDSIVFNLGEGNLVTIYKNGHEKRLPSPLGNSGKVVQSTGTGWSLVTPQGSSYDGNPSTITQDATHRFTTDSEKSTWSAKQDALGFTPAVPE